MIWSRVWLCSLVLLSLARASPQSTAPDSKPPRVPLQQDVICCYATHVVNPVYPRDARLKRVEGTVRLKMIVATDGTVADLQDVSGNPLLKDSVADAVRQWRMQPVLLQGVPREAEADLTFTFSIHNPPKPAYLHLKDGSVIRADRVREYTDGIEYKTGHHVYRISADSVSMIAWCGENCVPAGGPNFNIRAIPLLPAKEGNAPASH
jgi:TonB family protein